MSGPGPTPSPWGEPVRMPAVSARPAGPAARPTRPQPAAANRWGHPLPRERARAALTMFFVAVVLGAAAAGVLGALVWALATLFHHAASG